MRKSPEQFVHDVLAGGLGVRHVVIGFDFRFGHERAGDAEGLAALGADYDFGVTRIEPVAWQGEVCSSSRVREAVAHGDVGLARDLLGIRSWSKAAWSRVSAVAASSAIPPRTSGPARGACGRPTASMRSVRLGMRASRSGTMRSRASGCVLLRWRRPVLEIHLFEREVDLYGRRLCCAFVERLRAETTFATVEDLKAQMNQDSVAARAGLAAQPHREPVRTTRPAGVHSLTLR